MRAQILAAGVFFAVAGVYPVFGQALAEGALVHANSAAAGVKAGTALGNALNHATTQIGQQMHTVTTTHVTGGTPQSVPHTTAAVSGTSGSSAAPSSSSSGGLTITSIKGGQPATKGAGQPSTHSGGQPTCAPASANAAGNKTANGTAPQAPPCSAPTNTPTQSKSVVHLSFPQ
jgi:hypothetical protein